MHDSLVITTPLGHPAGGSATIRIDTMDIKGTNTGSLQGLMDPGLWWGSQKARTWIAGSLHIAGPGQPARWRHSTAPNGAERRTPVEPGGRRKLAADRAEQDQESNIQDILLEIGWSHVPTANSDRTILQQFVSPFSGLSRIGCKFDFRSILW